MTFIEFISGTDFDLVLAKKLQIFVPKHLQLLIERKTIDYATYGTNNEVKLKKILNLSVNLNNLIKGLDIIISFFNIERKKIKKIFPIFENQEEYFSHHVENFFIRITSLCDITGKIGNIIYETKLNERKCNCFTFKEKAKSLGYNDVSLIMEEMIQKISFFKEKRHKIIHKGENDIKKFKTIVYWDDLGEIIGENFSPILNDLTDAEIIKEIEILKEEVFEILISLKKMLDIFTKEIKKIEIK